MVMRVLVVSCAAAVAAGSSVRHTSIRQKLEVVQANRISPELDPESSKKFAKDYPDDGRPDIKSLQAKGFHDFKPPFPHVQESDSYDRDYVKDENSDNGEWQAQADYDRLKTKIGRAEEALAAAKKKENGEESEANGAEGKAKDAAGKAGDAKVKSENATRWRKEMEAEEKAAEQKAAASHAEAGKNSSTQETPKGPVEAARANLEKEQKEFEQCKKELEAARQHLADLQAALEAKKKEQLQKDKDEDAALVNEADADAKKADDAKKAADGVAAEEAAADKEAAAVTASEADIQKAADLEKKNFEKSQMSAAEVKEKLNKAEDELTQAEYKLKVHRGEAKPGLVFVPGKGMVKPEPRGRNSASTTSPLGLAVLATLMVSVLA